jgi:hypothetical protein
MNTYAIRRKRAEAIREHARRVSLPADEIFDLADLVVIRSDPVGLGAAAE